jgi:hypothetical protein
MEGLEDCVCCFIGMWTRYIGSIQVRVQRKLMDGMRILEGMLGLL